MSTWTKYRFMLNYRYYLGIIRFFFLAPEAEFALSKVFTFTLDVEVVKILFLWIHLRRSNLRALWLKSDYEFHVFASLLGPSAPSDLRIPLNYYMFVDIPVPV